MKSNQPATCRFWTFRRLARAVVWMTIVLGLYAGLGLGGWLFLRTNAGKLAGMASEDVEIGFGELITGDGGTIEFTDLRYGDIAKAERVTLKLDYDGFQVPRIRSIDILRPEVVVTDDLIAGNEENDSEVLDLSWLQLENATIREGKVRIALSDLPVTTAEFEVSATSIDGASGGALSTDPIELKLSNVEIEDYGRVAEGEFYVRVPTDLRSAQVEHFLVRGADIRAEDVAGFSVRGVIDIEGGRTDVSEEGISSGDLVKLALRDASLGDFASTKRVDLELIPDAFLKNGRIERLHVLNPLVKIDSTLMKKFEAGGGGDTGPANEIAEKAALVYSVRDLSIDEGSAIVDLGQRMPGIPHVKTDFSLHTEKEKHVLDFEDLQFRADGTAERTIARGQRLRAVFTAKALQVDRRIESVELFGFDATIGEAVQGLVEKLEQSKGDVTAVETKAEDDEIEWMINELLMNASRVTLDDLVPGLPHLPFQLDGIALTDVPLSGRDRGDERLQRVELANLEIASAENSLVNVALLRSIWVEFTVPGIFRSEIEKIEIVGPEIYVGEHLFWYIDYYREYDTETGTKKQAKPELELEPVVETGADGSINALEDAFSAVRLSGWMIKKIAAHNGKIIIAPRGVPLGIFPFPFSFATDLEERKIELALEVEQGDYTFEQISVELKQLKGKSFFNYPIRLKDNNFVQTFNADEMRYDQFSATDVALSVTYDREGIYGKIWASAYGGDMNAEFNIYIQGEEYKWDAWVSAVGFELGPFTNILVPDTFRMSGRVDGKLVANGVEFHVDSAKGDVSTGKGEMHVTKLDEIIATFPEEWSELKRMLVQAGLDVFRDYAFDEGKAKLDLSGMDGTASVFLDGPDGKRDVQFRFIDRRDGKGKQAALNSPEANE